MRVPVRHLAGAGFCDRPLTGAIVAPTVVPLAQGVLQAMFIAKLKSTGFALILFGLLAVAGGWSAHHALADSDEPRAQPAAEGQERRAERDGRVPAREGGRDD